jgi:hypothetical protein
MILLTDNSNTQLVTVIYLEINKNHINHLINLTSYPNVEKIIIDIEQGEMCFLPLTEFSFYTPSKLKIIKINSNSSIYFQDEVINLLCDKIKIKTLDLSNCSCGTMMPDKFSSIDNILLSNFFTNIYLSYNNITHTFGKIDYQINTTTLVCSYLNPKYLTFLRNLPHQLEKLKINFRPCSTNLTSDYYDYEELPDKNIINFFNNLPVNINLIQVHKSWNIDTNNIKKIPLNCKLCVFD